ncbi:PP0621 family protein [Ramlibacter sp. AN1015]|uniref:PP0621 family protein n=1 Tax=Ramlibacter sp. AN1015 TaxID=3133428 RepID=UPI0030BE1094
MKYLVLFAVLLLVYLLWRHERRSERQERAAGERAAPPRPPTGAPSLPQEMVRCSVCALHLPRTDALLDARGRTYCCPEHRQRDTA